MLTVPQGALHLSKDLSKFSKVYNISRLGRAERIRAEYLSRLSRGMATVRPEPGRPHIVEPSNTSADFHFHHPSLAS
jgi:hypothetical protein